MTDDKNQDNMGKILERIGIFLLLAGSILALLGIVLGVIVPDIYFLIVGIIGCSELGIGIYACEKGWKIQRN